MNQRAFRASMTCAIIAISGVAGSVYAQNVLTNPSFETLGSGVVGDKFANWVDFENCFVQDLDPRTGTYCVKAYGNNNGVPFNASGLYQEFTVTPGTAWKASVYARNRSADPITGLNLGALNIEWYDVSSVRIGFDTMTVANALTPLDQWIQKDGTFVAPPGAVKGRCVLLHLQAAMDPGAVQWDDVSIQSVPTVVNQLQNSSFETLGGGSPGNKFENWIDFNNCFVQTQAAHTGGISAKMFGNWSGAFNASGVFQEVPASAGQQWTASVFVFNNSQDAIAGLNFAAMNIEWFNGPTQISFDTIPVADAATPRDQWIRREVTFTAPAGTTTARYVLLHLQESMAPGAVLFDDASLGVAAAVCYPNCDSSSGTPLLTANDFSCFLNQYVAGNLYANCDGSSGTPLLTANDFSCFLNRYVAGCT